MIAFMQSLAGDKKKCDFLICIKYNFIHYIKKVLT